MMMGSEEEGDWPYPQCRVGHRTRFTRRQREEFDRAYKRVKEPDWHKVLSTHD